jgi:hypothetical protein
MTLKEFISNVLQDIDEGLEAASQKTKRLYSVNTGREDYNDEGVDFDIAITTSYSDSSKLEGSTKSGIIQVLS